MKNHVNVTTIWLLILLVDVRCVELFPIVANAILKWPLLNPTMCGCQLYILKIGWQFSHKFLYCINWRCFIWQIKHACLWTLVASKRRAPTRRWVGSDQSDSLIGLTMSYSFVLGYVLICIQTYRSCLDALWPVTQ